MNILFLYGNENTRELLDWLISQDNRVIATSEKVGVDFIVLKLIAFLLIKPKKNGRTGEYSVWKKR